MGLWGLSGFATLSLELIWMREMALWAGNTIMASMWVTTAFFGFTALGNLLGGRISGRAANPLRTYALFEMIGGLAAMVTFLICRGLWKNLEALPTGWLVPVAVTALIVGPASFCSGVAFPCLAEAFVASPQSRTSRASPFYAFNLLGAALGIVAGGVLLPLRFGVFITFLICASLQWIGGILAFRLSWERLPSSPEASKYKSRGWALLAASGLFCLAAQSVVLVWVRQILEGSVFAICGALTAFIGGLGLGALCVGTLRRRGRSTENLLFIFACGSCVLLLALPLLAGRLMQINIELTADTPVGMLAQAVVGCALVVVPLAFFLGGIFPLSWEISGFRKTGEGSVMGRALAINKLAAAAGSALGLCVLLPQAGLAHGTHFLAWAYLIIAAWVRRRYSPVLLLLLVAAIWQSATPAIRPGETPEVRVIQAVTSAYGPVTTVEDRQTQSRQIVLNNRQRLSGTQGALSSQRHQSWVPLLFCQDAKRVFTLGMAAGISAAAALDFPIRRLDAVELVPEVVMAARDHFSEWNAPLFRDPRAHVIIGDGRIVLAQSTERYDAIIADLFFPAEESTAHLYSRDFLALARGRLTPGGIVCVWLPCHQHTATTAGIVARTFLEVFPHAIAVRPGLNPLEPVVGWIGSPEPIPMSEIHLKSRLASVPVSIPSPFFDSEKTAMLLFAGDLRSADPGFGHFPITDDDHPVFAYHGPRQPHGNERLYGFPFLDWIGKRHLKASYPSCDLGETSAQTLLSASRAANYYFAAAAAQISLAGDRRTESQRIDQVQGYLRQAAQHFPGVSLRLDALGR